MFTAKNFECGARKKIPTASSLHCLLCRQMQPWCMMQCSWLLLLLSGPLRWPSAPCSVTATNPGALDHASWTSSKRSVSNNYVNFTELKKKEKKPITSEGWLKKTVLAWPPCIFDVFHYVWKMVHQIYHVQFLLLTWHWAKMDVR